MEPSSNGLATRKKERITGRQILQKRGEYIFELKVSDKAVGAKTIYVAKG